MKKAYLDVFLDCHAAKLQRWLGHLSAPCQAKGVAAAVTAALSDLFHIQAATAQKLTGQVNALAA